MDEIYKTYPIITENNCVIPSYPHPTNNNKFILLTPGAVGTWGRELLKRTPGISIKAPPPSLKYKDCKNPSSPAKDLGAKTPAIDQAQIVAIATAVAQAQVIAEAKIRAQASVRAASPGASSKHDTQNGTLSNCLDFGVVEDKDMILHILMTNEVDQYHLFKGNILTHDQLLKAGLNTRGEFMALACQCHSMCFYWNPVLMILQVSSK
ncbi:hypothetical protein PCANC_21662 [Puccinia coronata f. sp. avenae]|uniref:Uncharacterized protein n=1 Tax=Puccinia coronata f. sp. avenae TaxID=200324 RepID=A0A2N5SGY4_9BASI|nr:hypothetical protein PCANC_21662 [Puccinia coronata f. sp. avenae]